jgi:hypothetical protein
MIAKKKPQVSARGLKQKNRGPKGCPRFMVDDLMAQIMPIRWRPPKNSATTTSNIDFYFDAS